MSAELIKSGRGWVKVEWHQDKGQYHVAAKSGGTYMTRSHDDAVAYAKAFGRQEKSEDGRVLLKREIA